MINLLLALYLVVFGAWITEAPAANGFQMFMGLFISVGGLLIADMELDDSVRRAEWEDRHLENWRARLMEMEQEWR